MKIREYNLYPFAFAFTLATPKPDGAFSTVIQAAKIHEQYVSQVRAVLREFKHIDPTTKQIPAALRLDNYFPTANGSPLYALRTLTPAGTSREVDTDFWQDVTRIRYTGLLVFLPAALQADERLAFAVERHLEKAMLDLLTHLGLPTTFIPGDDTTRPGEGTVIDIIAELGPAEGAPGLYEVPTPA
jgi:hypothetical protein